LFTDFFIKTTPVGPAAPSTHTHTHTGCPPAASLLKAAAVVRGVCFERSTALPVATVTPRAAQSSGARFKSNGLKLRRGEISQRIIGVQSDEIPEVLQDFFFFIAHFNLKLFGGP